MKERCLKRKKRLVAIVEGEEREALSFERDDQQ
jgi:hypothetical protein